MIADHTELLVRVASALGLNPAGLTVVLTDLQDPNDPDDIDLSDPKKAWKRRISRMEANEILLVSGLLAHALPVPQQGGGAIFGSPGGGGVTAVESLSIRDEDEEEDPLEGMDVPTEAVRHLEELVRHCPPRIAPAKYDIFSFYPVWHSSSSNWNPKRVWGLSERSLLIQCASACTNIFLTRILSHTKGRSEA
jgi:hypothetical protein